MKIPIIKNQKEYQEDSVRQLKEAFDSLARSRELLKKTKIYSSKYEAKYQYMGRDILDLAKSIKNEEFSTNPKA